MTEIPEPVPHHQEIRVRFEAEMEGLRHRTRDLGGGVLDNIRRLSEAVLGNDLDLAGEVVAADDAIDEAYGKLEREAFGIIARQQPVAGDLRFLIAVTRILYELERSGDLAVNCAKGLLRHEGYRLPGRVHEALSRLFAAVIDIFTEGLDALEGMAEDAGERLDTQDDVVDRLTRKLYRHIVDKGRVDDLDLAVELSRTGRYLERIADHAVNIGEHVTFVSTGTFPQPLDEDD